MSAPWLSKLKGLDAYPKTIDEFKVRTLQGGLCTYRCAFSLLAFLCISLLLVSEVGYYFATDTVDKMVVDGGRNSMVSINFDVEFPSGRLGGAEDLSADPLDLCVGKQHDIEHNIEKIPLDRNGQAMTEGMRDVVGVAAWVAMGVLYSGSPRNLQDALVCFLQTCVRDLLRCWRAWRGTERALSVLGLNSQKLALTRLSAAAPQCCNTCDEVKAAYARKSWMMPSLHTITQCQEDEIEKVLRGEVNEGCRIKGSLVVSKVVPTEYTFLSASRIVTNQFSATEHFRQLTPVSDKGLPMVSFGYTFSPIMFRIEQYRVGFLQFLTSVCAIVGGVFTSPGGGRTSMAEPASSPLPPLEQWNLAVVLVLCGLLGWMLRLLRLLLTFLEARFAIQQGAVKADKACVVQIFWGVRADALQSACRIAASESQQSPLRRRRRKRRDAALQVQKTLRAVCSLPEKFNHLRRQNAPHQLNDDDVETEGREAAPTEQMELSLAGLFVGDDAFRRCSTMER
ncbi:hypothetical protein BBJ28_00001108 [Nothophytophthora sp. Chile5]|nr:hypothetical protein BBJ28_00001108 [Nothophytophthora sp. Chile5]